MTAYHARHSHLSALMFPECRARGIQAHVIFDQEKGVWSLNLYTHAKGVKSYRIATDAEMDAGASVGKVLGEAIEDFHNAPVPPTEQPRDARIPG